MPQNPQQPQLDPNFDWAKLPDGSYAKFPKGTSQVAIEGQLAKAGLIKPKTPTPKGELGGIIHGEKYNTTYGGTLVKPGEIPPYYGFTPTNMAGAAAHTVVDFGKFLKDVGGDLLSNPNWFKTMPADKRPSTMQKFVTEPAKEQLSEASKAYKEGRYSEAAGHGLAGVVPMVGPFAASIGEQAGKGDVGGALGQVVGMYMTGKALEKGRKVVVDKTTQMVSPKSLRRRAADLNTKVLKSATPDARDFGKSVGLQVAKEAIISNLEQLPAKIEAKRINKNSQVQALAKQLDAAGTTIDVSQDIQAIENDVKTIANQRGLLTPQLRTQIKGLLNRVTTQVDPTTGKPVPRNLTQLKVSDALKLQEGLKDTSAFGKVVPDAINNLARRIRGALGNKIGNVSPEMQRLRAEESKLIKARDAAKDNYAKALNDNRTLAKGFVYSTASAATGYIALKMAGIGFGPAIAGILVLRTLAESTVSRTARAALYAKTADAIDAALAAKSPQGGATGAQGAATGPKGPQAGGSPITGGTPPQAVANAQLAAAIGTPKAVAVAVAPQLTAGAATIDPDLGVSTGPETSSTKADASKIEIQNLERKLELASSDERQAILKQLREAQDRAAGVKPVAESEIKDVSKMGRKAAADKSHRSASIEPIGSHIATSDITKKVQDITSTPPRSIKDMEDIVKGLSNVLSDLKQNVKKYEEAEAGGSVAKSNTKTAAKSPEAVAEAEKARNKAMMDRLDNLIERQANPKSGADRNAIEREIAEIKRLLSGEATGSKATAIRKKIADRERLAGKRAEAKAATPGTSTTAQTGSTVDPATRPEASPENRAILLDMGYKKLATYEGGPEMVKALQKMAQDVRKVDPSYDEVTALADALKALKEVSGQ